MGPVVVVLVLDASRQSQRLIRSRQSQSRVIFGNWVEGLHQRQLKPTPKSLKINDLGAFHGGSVPGYVKGTARFI